MARSRKRRHLLGTALALGLLAIALTLTWSAFAGSADPSGVRIVTEDIERFWAAVDSAPDDDLAERLRRDYLAAGTRAVRDFVAGRIVSADALAEAVQSGRARYDSIRAASLALRDLEPAIREALWAFEGLYPQARFPDVYFVIGRFNTGGTTSRRGVLVGAEMVARQPAEIPPLVVHESVHFQQPRFRDRAPTLLQQSLREGVAAYVAALATGVEPDSVRHAYGREHEAALWAEFHRDLHRPPDAGGWLYGGEPEGRPRDLGYFFGFRIAEAYVDAAPDTAAAVARLIESQDAASILVESGYEPR